MHRAGIYLLLVLWAPLVALLILWSDAWEEYTKVAALLVLGLLPLGLLIAYWAKRPSAAAAWAALASLAALAACDGLLWLGNPKKTWFTSPDDQAHKGFKHDLGPFVPTPQPVVDRMLQMAGVTKDDIVYDLGCGDGRIVVTAAKTYGACGVGIEKLPHVAAMARDKVSSEGVQHLVEIREEDAMDVVDLERATVIALYILPDALDKFKPQFKRLKKGTRIVSHNYDMVDWEPDRMTRIYASENPDLKNKSKNDILMWIVK